MNPARACEYLEICCVMTVCHNKFERHARTRESKMAQDKRQLRTTFDEDALLYDQARQGYPEALFNDIVALSDIPSHGRILEIGCGTGQATVPLARRGYRI